jgi:hypothetical protein
MQTRICFGIFKWPRPLFEEEGMPRKKGGGKGGQKCHFTIAGWSSDSDKTIQNAAKVYYWGSVNKIFYFKHQLLGSEIFVKHKYGLSIKS